MNRLKILKTQVKSGRSLAPVIAVLVIVSGATAGAWIRSKQHGAPETRTIEPDRSAFSTSQSPANSSIVNTSVLVDRHSIPLGTEDIDDTVEAPSIAVSDSGVVYVAWATQTGEMDRALMMSRSEDGGRTWLEPWQVLTSPIHVAGQRNAWTQDRTATSSIAITCYAWREGLPVLGSWRRGAV